MAINELFKNIANNHGSKFNIYGLNGELLGVEKAFVFPFKRSMDENIAIFGRSALFHKDTKAFSGCIIEDVIDKEKYFINSKRYYSLNDTAIMWSIFLLQINFQANFYRYEITSVDSETGEAVYTFNELAKDKLVYIEKKDWTMEEILKYGRDKKGYETLICQMADIKRGDYIKTSLKTYIIQDISTSRENMLTLQIGLDTHARIS